MNAILEAHALPHVPMIAVLPFAILLLAIAVLPLAAAHWWEHNKNKAIIAALTAAPILFWGLSVGLGHKLAESVEEYIGFIIMLGSLFTISGGIFVDGEIKPKTSNNAKILALGAIIANLVGTTGAAMLLIRPLLRANQTRKNIVHTVVFFIFIVCNTGGCLTPLGDPPLYLGFNRGVPFTWTLGLWPYWLAINATLVFIYCIWDSRLTRNDDPSIFAANSGEAKGIRLFGGLNLVFLLGVVAAVAKLPHIYKEGTMIALSIASLVTTKTEIRQKNGFSWGPIIEVAVLFAGIFVTMVPALLYLDQNAKSMGIEKPIQFFWFTGTLSSFLDNAPTYLTFLSLCQGLGLENATVHLKDGNPVPTLYLVAISLGAVFMGANTYIGNGPNFMVKAIADGAKVKMPSFFGYMAYSIGILVPIFIVLSLVAFRGH